MGHIFYDTIRKEYEKMYGQIPQQLTAEETIQAAHDKDINKIVEGNMRLVLSVANRYHGLPYDDLVQEGMLGLMEAAQRYEPDKGKFSPYATAWIEKYMLQALDRENALRVTDYGSRQQREVQSKTKELQQTLRREPTVQELAEATGMTEKAVKRTQRTHISIDEIEEEPLTEDFSTDSDTRITAEQIYEHLHLLTEKEREVLYYRYGFIDEPLTHTETARRMGISRTYVRKLEASALQKLQGVMT